MIEKQVQIRRKESNADHIPVVALNEIPAPLSSVYKGGAVHRGLTEAEEKKYLYPYLGLSESNPNHRKQVLDWWKDLSIPITVTGAILNISTLDDEETPINVLEWVKWKWAKSHPLVASSQEEMLKDHRKRFYIYDPDEQDRTDNVQNQLKIEGFAELGKLFAEKEDDTTINHVCLRYGLDYRNLNRIQKETSITSMAESDMKKFLGIVKDPLLKRKAIVIDLINLNILNRTGSTIMYVDTVLGHSLKEAALWLENKENSETVNVITGRYKSEKKDLERQLKGEEPVEEIA